MQVSSESSKEEVVKTLHSEANLIKREKYRGRNVAGNIQGKSLSYRYETGVEVGSRYLPFPTQT